jgi:hypothetical protein
MYREGEEQSGFSYLPARSPDNRFPKNLESRTDGQLPGNVSRWATEQEDSRIYHIVLKTERLSIDSCVKAVCDLAESPRFRDRATARSMLANKLLEAKIGSAFAEHISFAAAPLGVSVSVADGKVTLAGTTSSGSVRNRAEKIAREVARVFHIDNRIVSVPSRGGAF